jgi:SAM-dependent methyltransferase
MFDTYEGIFSKRAHSYEEAMARWPDARKAEFEMALAPLPLAAGSVVCDMPAGGGYLRRHLPAGVSYVAVEPSEPFFANCPCDEAAMRLQCALDEVSLADASVDHVVSVAGLHHVPELDAVFREMRRLVRPDGWVVVADVNAGSASDDFLNGFVDARNPLGHKGVFFDDATPGRLAKAGLRVVDDRIVATPWSFASPAEMGAYCRALFGIADATVAEVVEQIDLRLGRCPGPGAVNFGWPLRRLVCRPA